jgi:hypothetical protein
METFRIVIFVLSTVLLPRLVFAHHAFSAEFDEKRTVSFSGVITKIDWINPHAYFYLDSKDSAGRPVSWTIESFPPAALRRAGLTREMLKIGSMVSVQAYAAKDGTKTGWAHKIQFADGRVINISREPEPAK